MSAALRFLSEEWFAAYAAATADLEVSPGLAEARANINIKRDDGELLEARIEGGLLRRGGASAPLATITAPEDIIYKALVIGDVQAAVRGMLTGAMQVEGNKAALIKIAMSPQTASQKALVQNLKQITSI